SDTGGSLRNPAAYANVYGFRPSQGRVPKLPGPERLFQQLGTAGAMGRTRADVPRLFAVQAGHDPRSPPSFADDRNGFGRPARPAAQPIRVGWLADLDGYLPMEEGILPLCEAALREFEGAGARVESLGRAAVGVAPEAVWEAWMRLRSLLVGGSLAGHYNDPSRRELL